MPSQLQRVLQVLEVRACSLCGVLSLKHQVLQHQDCAVLNAPASRAVRSGVHTWRCSASSCCQSDSCAIFLFSGPAQLYLKDSN